MKEFRRYSKDEPFVVHIENSSTLQPVFIVRHDQYEAALNRHPEVACNVRTTFGCDGDSYDTSIRDADALIGYKFPRDRFRERAPKLKWIQVLAAGIDYLLPLDWVPNDLQLTNNCGAHVPKAAESALMAILMVNARIPVLVTGQRKREWNRIFTSTVAGKTLLIVGVGHIGGGAAEQAKRVGMHVIGTRRGGQAHPAVAEMHKPDALHALLPRADIVLVNAALTSQTYFLMGKREFDLMRPSSAFINMARGDLVDPAALQDALRNGHLSCAVIDVTCPEPLPPDSHLWEAPNLIVTPRILGAAPDQFIPRTLDIFFENVRRHMAGEPLGNLIGIEREY